MEATLRPIVYLGGPITGLSFSSADDWRKGAKEYLAPGIHCVSPLRNKDLLKGDPCISAERLVGPGLSDRHILTQNHFDVRRCSVVLMNFLGATFVSPGSPIELGWCWEQRKPVIAIMEPDGNPYDHPMVREIITHRYEVFLDALNAVRDLVGVS